MGEVLWTKVFGVIKTDQSVSLYETGIKFIHVDPVAVGRVYTYSRQMKQKETDRGEAILP